MAGPIWSIKVDGNELNNTALGRLAAVPEVDVDPDMDLILAPVDGDYPAVVRLQPREGRYTILVQRGGISNADWQTELAFLRGICTVGKHVLTLQVRGMSAPKSVTIWITGRAAEFTLRRFVATATAAKPVLV